MNDPPGLPAAVSIEAVQWLPGPGENLAVRVRGRWRRGRPTWGGQPLLVIEAEGRRHRFPAMPEPPSPTGAAPGTWQISFSVPASLPQQPDARAWLQLGGAVVLPLPLPVQRASAAAPDAPEDEPRHPPAADAQLLAERRLRSAELAAEAARRREAEAEAAAAQLRERIAELEAALESARREPERMQALLAARDRAVRAAEQRAHAEYALRLELEEQLAHAEESDAGPAEPIVEDALRITELEREVERLTRALAEAEHLAQAAMAARRRAEQRLAEQRPPPASATAKGFAGEAAVARRAGAAPLIAPEAPAVPSDAELLAREASMTAARAAERAAARAAEQAASQADARAAAQIASLRRELEERSRAEAALAAQVADLRVRPPALSEDLQATLAELRAELGRLRAAAELEANARAEAEARAAALERQLEDQAERVARAYEAIAQLRAQLAALRPDEESGPWQKGEAPASAETKSPAPERQGPASGETEAPSPEGQGPASAAQPPGLDPDRLNAALSRLREASQPDADVTLSQPSRGTWLERALRELARRHRATSGRVLLAALRAAAPHERRLEELVRVDPPRVAEALTGGPLRRRLGRLLLDVPGRRARLNSLTEIVRSPPPVAWLELDPLDALALVAALVEPDWTVGEQFTVAYRRPDADRPEALLRVADGSRPTVSAPLVPASGTSTIVCPPSALPAVLAGAEAGLAMVEGEEQPLVLVRRWVARAQSG